MYRNFIAALLIFLMSSWALGGSRAAEEQPHKVFILCYHTFYGDRPKNPYDIPPEDFSSEIKTLREHGVHFIQFSDIANNRVSAGVNVLITFDDGALTTRKVYQEVLKPLGIKPMLAIYPAIIGRKKNALSWDQIREFASDGCEIASHGYYHLYVAQKLYDTDRKSFMNEIYKSKKVLEDKLKQKITLFVYPFGLRSDITKTTLKEAGYEYAFNITGKHIELPLDEKTDRYDLSRYLLTKENRAGVIRSIISHAQ